MKEIDSFRNDVTYFYGSLQRSVLFFFFSGKLFLACFFVVCFVCFHSNFLLLFLFLFLFYFSFSLFLSIFCPLFFSSWNCQVYRLLFLFTTLDSSLRWILMFSSFSFHSFLFFFQFFLCSFLIILFKSLFVVFFSFSIFDSSFPSHCHSHFIFFFHHLNYISLFPFLYNFINFFNPSSRFQLSFSHRISLSLISLPFITSLFSHS